MRKPKVIVTGTRDGAERAAQEAVEPKIHAAAGQAPASRSNRARDLAKAASEAIEAGLRDGLKLDSDEMVYRVRAARAKIPQEPGQQSESTRGVGESTFKTEAAQQKLRQLMKGPAGLRSARASAAERRRAKTDRCHAKWRALAITEKQKPGRSQRKWWAIAREIAPRCLTTRGARPKTRTVWNVIKMIGRD